MIYPQIFSEEDINLVEGFDVDDSGVKICILDTGIDKTHHAIPSLGAEIDLVNNDSDATDDNGHGTHVAGIISSTDSKYPGIAPNASLFIAKVLDEEAKGVNVIIMSGIEWCVSNNVDIISISVGGSEFEHACDEDSIAIASNKAVDLGVVVVASTGTRGSDNGLMTPACASKVIAVGGIDQNDEIGIYSNKGVEIDLVAPGSDIMSSDPEKGFITRSGTSMAVPHVSGIIALMLEIDSSLTPQEIQNILERTANDLGSIGFDDTYGHGKINIDSALRETHLGKQH